MIEYVGDSRIDGCPLVKLSNDNHADTFLKYFRNLNFDIGHVQNLSTNENQSFIVKVITSPLKFKKELKLFDKYIRIKKLEQLDEQ